jgi:hypothetical protein
MDDDGRHHHEDVVACFTGDAHGSNSGFLPPAGFLTLLCLFEAGYHNYSQADFDRKSI